ncbi:STAS domain-containing protein [Actinophytocola sp.]|uniref:STAS domain-containing protein n=1 Tax=Actinophytocola sp. TaxID=1872138 RepID=UPI00389A7BFA
MTPLTVTSHRRDDGTVVLTAAGEIDMSNIDTFDQALTEAGDTRADRQVVVDLTAVDYLDSSAINVLSNHAEHLRLITNPLLLRVFTISGLTELTTVESGAPREA